jgi:hypothetical protein
MRLVRDDSNHQPAAPALMRLVVEAPLKQKPADFM